MKRLLVILLMLLMATAIGAPPSRTYTYTAGAIIQPAEVTANEDNIYRYLTAGVDTLAANSVATSNIQDGSVTTGKILNGTIVNADISAGAAIPYSKLSLGTSILGTDLAANIAISTTGTINTTSTTTTSGLYVTGLIKDNYGNWGSNGQALTTSGSIVKWKQMGKVIQVVNYHTGETSNGAGVFVADDGIPEKTEGNEVMTLAITPTSLTNKLRIDVTVMFSNSDDTYLITALFKDATTNALASTVHRATGAGIFTMATFSHYMTAGTTSATTFKVRIGGTSGTMTFNGTATARALGGSLSSSITITEIEP